jgi:phosphate-selective porin OprO/OprP
MKKTPFSYYSKTAIAIAVTAALGVTAQADDNDIKVFWKDSLRLESVDGNNKLRVGGRIHWDNAFFADDEFGDKSVEDGDVFRRTRLYLSGQVQERYDFKMQYDFAGGDAAFKDVYFGIKDLPILGNLRVGQFKEPLSLEELNSSNNISNIELANVNRLVPSRSAGIMAYNNYADSRITSAIGLFRGADDSYGNYKGDGYAATARLSGLPYRNDDASQLAHLGIGYSYRSDDTATYKLASDHSMAPSWEYSINEVNNTSVLGLEAALKLGSFSVQSEWVQADVDAPEGGNLDGCYIQAGYVLTGESRSYDTNLGAFKGVSPSTKFMEEGGLGAWEAVLRWSNLDFSDLADSREVDTWTLGLNWYLNKNVRALFNYSNADLDGDSVDVFATRFQFAF